MEIKELKNELGLNNEQIAEFFGYKKILKRIIALPVIKCSSVVLAANG